MFEPPKNETREERRARWLSTSVSSKAMPTRSAENKGQWDRMKRWEGEHDAAREIVKSGGTLESLSDAPAQLKAMGG